MKKTVILHDTFLYKWWGERLILMMGKILWADIASWFFSQWSFDLKHEWFQWKMIRVSSEIFKKWFRHIKLKWAFLFRTKFLVEYDNVIFSGDCISAVRNCNSKSKKYFIAILLPDTSMIYMIYICKKYLCWWNQYLKYFVRCLSIFTREIFIGWISFSQIR